MLAEPPIVVNAKRDYKGEHDLIGAFLEDYCNVGNPNAIVSTTSFNHTNNIRLIQKKVVLQICHHKGQYANNFIGIFNIIILNIYRHGGFF